MILSGMLMTTLRKLGYTTLSCLILLSIVTGCDTFMLEDTPANNTLPENTPTDAILPATPTENIPAENTPANVRIDTIVTYTPQTPTATDIPPTPTPTQTSTPMPFDLESAITVMNGLCFESIADATGQVFILRTAEEHANLYDLAENSELCRRPIIRNPFDFNNGRILVGTWTYGIGCDADHDILNVARDDDDKTIVIDLRFVTYGDCPYELVRPFWVAFNDAQDYAVILNVEQPSS